MSLSTKRSNEKILFSKFAKILSNLLIKFFLKKNETKKKFEFSKISKNFFFETKLINFRSIFEKIISKKKCEKRFINFKNFRKIWSKIVINNDDLWFLWNFFRRIKIDVIDVFNVVIRCIIVNIKLCKKIEKKTYVDKLKFKQKFFL